MVISSLCVATRNKNITLKRAVFSNIRYMSWTFEVSQEDLLVFSNMHLMLLTLEVFQEDVFWSKLVAIAF